MAERLTGFGSVLASAGDVRTSRLALCRATRRVPVTGPDLLGIAAPDRM